MVLAVLLLAVVAGVWFALSEAGLPFLIARIVAQSGGRLRVEGPAGSIASSVRFDRLNWTGTETTVEATDVVLDWDPRALWRSRVAIRSLGARRVAIAVKPSGGPTPPPTDLTLPLEVTIDRITIGELAWQAGPRGGSITGLEFGYHGGAAEHAIDGLRLQSELGALSGAVTLGARAPLPLRGQLAVAGVGPLAGVQVSGSLGGTLTAIDVAAHGTLRGADLDATASLTPFQGAPLARAQLTLQHLDAHAFGESLPRTAVAVSAAVLPVGNGFAGDARVTNEAPGPLDAERLPFVSLAAHYRWQPAGVELTDLLVALPGNGTVTGRASVPLNGPRASATLALTVHDVDPQRLHGALVSMHLNGTIDARIDGDRQRIAGALADGRNELRFAATVASRNVDVEELHLKTAGGDVAGRAHLALDDRRAFEAHLVATRFDPSRFVASAAAALDGTIDARGTLRPLEVHAESVVRPGSRYGGVAVAGTARADVAWPRLRGVAVDATAGSAHVTLAGDAGAVGDRLGFTLSAPRVVDLAPLLPAAARPSAGSVQARGTVAIEPGGIGGEFHASAAGLRVVGGAAAATLAVDGTLAPGGAAAHPTPPEMRRFEWTAAATHVTAASTTGGAAARSLDEASVSIAGTLAQHALRLRGRGEGLAVQASASGRFTPGRELAASAWDGRIDTFDTTGRVASHLRGPAGATLARDRLRLADAHLDIADGHADVTELRIDGGRVTTHGSFTGVPLGAVLALAGAASPLATTLVLGGDWSIDAAPQLNGRFAVRREQGDVYASETVPGVDRGGLSFGITTLELTGTLHDDALAAQATLASTRAGNARGELRIDSVAGAVEGKLASSAPLSGRLEADLASLAPLQPLLGTQAVLNGRLRAALRVAGTLGAPTLAGTLDGNALRLDAPQYGIHVTDGRVRARLSGDAAILDELSFAGGDGRFTAHGTLGLPGRAAAGSQVTWQAEHFRVADRPDLKLVLAGNGTLGIDLHRIALKGEVRVEQGHVEYEPSPPGRLGDDVHVKGRPVTARSDTGPRDLPLALELDVDLGRALTFSGEGLEATIAGRINVSTRADGTLRGRGTLRTQYGTYYAFGQKLTIDRGQLIFDGPLDNPALDIVALRKNLPVEAGVELSGSVKVPLVRITSNPPVPENEALAWLITGQGLSGAGRSDYAALSTAAGALLGRNGKPMTTRIAQQFGLDDISLQSSGTATGTSTNPIASQVVVFGKRISDRLTLGYEQGLSLASGAVRLEYALTRTLTLRAEAGTISALGLVFRRSFE